MPGTCIFSIIAHLVSFHVGGGGLIQRHSGPVKIGLTLASYELKVNITL